MKHCLLIASIVAAFGAMPASANTVGAPFFTIEKDDVGLASILDFFEFGLPSGRKEVSLSGTISSAQGAPSLVGTQFSFETSVTTSDTMLTIDGYALTDGTIGSDPDVVNDLGTTPGQFWNPFQPGPGDLNFLVFAEPAYVETSYDLTTDLGTYDYPGGFAPWSDLLTPGPGFELLISVYLDGPLPISSVTDPGGTTETFVQGPLSVAQITVGTIGGAPLEDDTMAPVPLPAGLPLLVAGLGGLALLRNRRTSRPA